MGQELHVARQLGRDRKKKESLEGWCSSQMHGGRLAQDMSKQNEDNIHYKS